MVTIWLLIRVSRRLPSLRRWTISAIAIAAVAQPGDALADLVGGFLALDGEQVEVGKFLPGVAQAGAGDIAEFPEAQGFRVDQDDAVPGLADQGTVDQLPLGQGQAGPQVGDTAGQFAHQIVEEGRFLIVKGLGGPGVKIEDADDFALDPQGKGDGGLETALQSGIPPGGENGIVEHIVADHRQAAPDGLAAGPLALGRVGPGEVEVFQVTVCVAGLGNGADATSFVLLGQGNPGHGVAAGLHQ